MSADTAAGLVALAVVLLWLIACIVLGPTAYKIALRRRLLAHFQRCREIREQRARIFFPLIRRVVPNLIVSDLVSVQPMQSPAGTVFYLQFVYGSGGRGWTAGDIAGDRRRREALEERAS